MLPYIGKRNSAHETLQGDGCDARQGCLRSISTSTFTMCICIDVLCDSRRLPMLALLLLVELLAPADGERV